MSGQWAVSSTRIIVRGTSVPLNNQHKGGMYKDLKVRSRMEDVGDESNISYTREGTTKECEWGKKGGSMK